MNSKQFLNCDILIGSKMVEKYGFDKNYTKEEIVALAIQHQCPIIVRAGPNAKWYLKGNGCTESFLMRKINEDHRKREEKGVKKNGTYVILLTQLCKPEEEKEELRGQEEREIAICNIEELREAQLRSNEFINILNEQRKELSLLLIEKAAEVVAEEEKMDLIIKRLQELTDVKKS